MFLTLCLDRFGCATTFPVWRGSGWKLACCSCMRAGQSTIRRGGNVRKARGYPGVLLALLLLQASCFLLLPTSPARAVRCARLHRHRQSQRLSKLQLVSFLPAPRPQLAATNRGQRRVTPLSSVEHRTAVVAMGASSSRLGESSPQQKSTLIADDRISGGGYGAVESSLRAAASGETDSEDPETGELPLLKT